MQRLIATLDLPLKTVHHAVNLVNHPHISHDENLIHMKKRFQTIAGLPHRVAITYALVFVLAFCFYSILWSNAPVLQADSGSYLRSAQDLSDLKIDHLQERAPFYPLLLVITSSSKSPTRALFFVSLLLYFTSIYLLATLLYRGGLTEAMLILFGFILLLPPYVEPTAYVLTENLAQVMLAVGFTSCVVWLTRNKSIWILISTLTIACAALTRPTYQLLALAMAGFLWIARFLLHWVSDRSGRVIRGSLILLIGSVFLLGSYAYFNYRNFGYFGVTPKLGLTLNTKTWRFVERLPEKYTTLREALIRARNAELVQEGSSHEGSMYIWRTVPELTKLTGLEYQNLSNYMMGLNLMLIKTAPLAYLHEAALAFASYWFPAAGELSNLNSRALQLFWALIHFCVIGTFALNLILLFGAGLYFKKCIHLVEQRSTLFVCKFRVVKLQALMYGLAATMVFYTAGISCLVEVGDPRYRIPTDTLIVFMIFLGTNLWRGLVNLFEQFFPTQLRRPASKSVVPCLDH